MKVLCFVDAPHRLAGAQRSLLAALSGLPAEGVTPRVVFPAEGRCVDAYRAAGVDCVVLPAPAALLEFGKAHLRAGKLAQARVLVTACVPYARALARLARAWGADLLHFNTPRGILAAGLAARLVQRPTVLHLRGAVPFGGPLWFAAQALADRIVLVAHALEPEVARPFRRRTRVVYNGVTIPELSTHANARTDARAALTATFGVPREGALFVALSSPVPFKGLHHLLDAACRARDAGLDAHYLLAGSSDDARYTDWLTRRRDTLGLGSAVTFAGFVGEPATLLAGADALVLPSIEREQLDLDGTTIDVRGNEGLPRSVLEAMAHRLPVIASRLAGAVEEVEEGESGLLVPPGDPRALAEALLTLARDASFRTRAGARGRELAETRFSVGASARGLAAVFRELH